MPEGHSALKLMRLKMPARKTVPLLAGFLIFVLVTSLVRNLYFPVIEPFGEKAVLTRKVVIGFPTFFVPEEFEGCIVLGPRLYPLALILNLAQYSAVAAALSCAGSRITRSLHSTPR